MHYRIFVRRFLNARHQGAGAYVLASVADTTGERGSYVRSDTRLEIGDCYRRVSLDFSTYTASERRNSVAKAKLLAEVLTRFAAALEQEAKLETEREQARDSAERVRRGSTRGKSAWRIYLRTDGAIRGLGEATFDRLTESLETYSAFVMRGTDRSVSVMMTVWACCRQDAPAIGAEIMRTALTAVGIAWTGEIVAELDDSEAGM
jgi:hypothetical protein